MFKKITLATALIASLGTAHAYQAEVGATAKLIDPDNGSNSAGFALDGTYYFNPVQIKNSPLNEAAFLNRSSNVNAQVSYDDFDVNEYWNYGVGVEYFVPNTDFYLNANISQETEKAPNTPDFDITFYKVEAGYFLAPSLLVAAGLRGWDHDYDDGIDPTIRAKYVTQIGANDVNLEAGAAFGDLDEFSLRGDYYIDKTLSVGVDYFNQDFNGGSFDEFGVNAKKFFNQKVSVEGRIGFADDGNTFAVRGAYRF
ncbi:putative porin [Acinetobacter sp. YH12239]|uniref:putative porin n=1 Tax=Acinetobacter sp. YH12239 TaxID=2601166 RepID=UPI0015D20D54|nr:putative porin [Acinetobacter sp. YH12239]